MRQLEFDAPVDGGGSGAGGNLANCAGFVSFSGRSMPILMLYGAVQVTGRIISCDPSVEREDCALHRRFHADL